MFAPPCQIFLASSTANSKLQIRMKLPNRRRLFFPPLANKHCADNASTWLCNALAPFIGRVNLLMPTLPSKVIISPIPIADLIIGASLFLYTKLVLPFWCTLASYAVSMKMCPASLVSVYKAMAFQQILEALLVHHRVRRDGHRSIEAALPKSGKQLPRWCTCPYDDASCWVYTPQSLQYDMAMKY